MKYASAIRALASLALLWTLSCAAQQYGFEEPDRWHMKGTVGFDWSKNTDVPIVNGIGQESDFNGIAGDVGLDLSGFVKDPKFITFQTDFNTQQGSNSLTAGDYGQHLLGGGFSMAFLPVSHYPFRLSYHKSAFDTSGSLFGSNNNYSQLSADWTVDYHNLPRLMFSHNRSTNDVELAESITNTGYNESDWGVQAQDTRAGWHWIAAYNFGNIDTNSTGALNFLAGSKEDYKTLSANGSRLFWDNKGLLQMDTRRDSYHYQFPGDGTSDTATWLTTTSLQLQHTPKFTTRYYYFFTHESLTNESPLTVGPAVTFLETPTFNTHTLGARAEYQLFKPLRVFQEMRYDHYTPLVSTLELRTSLTESLTGFEFQQRLLHQFELSGSYTARFDFMGTNLSNHDNSFSNDVDARLGWGDVRRIHLQGTYRKGRLNYVEQLGGFSDDQRYGVQAESTVLHPFRLMVSAERGSLELLNVSGDIQTSYRNYMVQIEHPKFVLTGSRGLNDGSGALFPENLNLRQFLTIALPVDQLIGTPLLNRLTHTSSVDLLIKPKRTLSIGADWRNENNLLFNNTQNYRIWEVRGEYRLGKITLDGGVGNLRSQVDTLQNLSGLRINRYFFRIRRDFNFF